MKLNVLLILILLNLIAITGNAQSWTALNGPTGGIMKKIEMDNNGRVYALTGQGQLFASSNGGTTWANISTSLSYLHGFTLEGNTLYANSWQEIYSSADGGVTWVKKNTTNLGYLDIAMYKIPGVSNGLFVYGNQGAWISVDGGVNWKKIYDKIIYRSAYSSGGDIYIAVPSVGILKHPVQTSAANWDQAKWVTIKTKAYTAGTDDAITVGVNQNNSDKVFISYRNVAGTAMQYDVSTNGGSTFTPITAQNPYSTASDWYSFSGKFYHLIGSEIYEVNDGSIPTFTKKGSAGYSYYNIKSFYFKSIGEIYAGVEGDGVWKSTDNASSFAPSNGTPPNAIMNIPAKGIEYIGGKILVIPHSDSKGYWTSTDGGVWSWLSLPFTIQAYRGKQFNRIQDNSILASTSQGTQRTTDGVVWAQMNTESFHSYLPIGSTEIYGFRDGGIIKKSNNQGTSWTTVTVANYPVAAQTYFSAYDGVNIYTLIHTGNNAPQIWKININTLTSSQVPVDISGAQNIWDISGMFVFKGKLYIGDRRKIAISNDQGATFKYLNYDHTYLFPIDQKVGGIGISKSGSLVITKDDGVTLSSTILPFRESQIVSIVAPNGSSGDTYAAALGSPALKFASADSLIRNASTPYINFGWTKVDGPYGGGQGRRLFKSSSKQLFMEGWNSIHWYNSVTSKWELLDNTPTPLHGAFHDGTNLYVAKWGNLHKSTDGGNTFTELNAWGTQFSGPDGNGSGLFKSSTGTIFILSGNGLYRSTNDGVTFAKILSGKLYISIAEAGSNLVAVSETPTGLAVERSTDNGVTWTSAMTGLTITSKKYENLLHAMETGAITLTTNDNIYRTVDGGQTWTSIKSNLGTLGETTFCCWNGTYAAPNGDYYFFSGGNPAKVYVSTNQGGSWARKNSGATSSSPLNYVKDALWIDNRLYVVSSYLNGVLYSDDGGVTFSTLSNNAGLNSFKEFIGGDLRVSGGKLTIANGSTINISTDGGTTWAKTDYPVSKIISSSNGDLIAYGGNILKSTDLGSTWSVLNNQNYFHHLVTGDGIAYFGRTGDRKFLTSTDFNSWTEVTVSGLPTDYNLYDFESMAALGNKYYVVIFNNTNLRSEFYEISSGVATKITIDVSPNQVVGKNGKLYLMASESIYESTDGTSWSKRAIPGGANHMIFANNGYLFLTGDNGLVWVSRDGGLSWQNVSATNLKARIDDIAVDLTTGIAYGSLPSKPLYKSSSIVVPDDKAGPSIGSVSPANGATGISKTGLKLAISFNEGPKAVAGKNLKIYNAASSTSPVETIAVTNGVAIDNKITFTTTFTPDDLGVYYVVIDAGAFTDFYNNASVAVTDPNFWRFTMADATAPTLTFTPSNLNKGSAKVFEITITDAGGIATDKTKIYYRGITSTGTSFSSADMIQVSGGTPTNSKFDVTALETWYDGIGLEFYIEAEDIAGNKSRSPLTSTSYHYSYITFPAANKPKISGLAFGGDASTYRIISIPYKLENNSISTIFDEMGGANKKNWRLITYAGKSGGTDNWNEFDGGAGLSSIERGKGYWFNAKNDTEIFIEGASTPENNRTSFFKINLQPGWNQIGNPYPIAMNWTETIAGKTGIGQVKKYLNGTYSNTETLNPYEGGFVFVTGASQQITVRFPGITTGGRIESKELSGDLSSPSWSLPLIVEQGLLRNELSGIGMNPQANVDFDVFDDLNMPGFEGVRRADLEFAKSAGEIKVLSKDIVPTLPEYVWDFTLNTNGNESTELTWNNSLFGNNSKELYLLDEDTQMLINMRSQSSYSFDPVKSSRFKIYFGEGMKEKIKPGKILLGQAYPNPATDNISVPFTLSDEASLYDVQLEIYNTQGAKMATIYKGQLTPGFYNTTWSFEGTPLNNGLYLVKMVVRGKVSEVQTEKIIINR